MTTAGLPASRVKLVCLVVVLVGCVATAVGGRSDLAVMLGVLGVGLFVGLGLVPMGQISAGVRLPGWFAGLFVLQAFAIAGFVLLQPVSAPSGSGSRVGLLALLGHPDVGRAGLAQALAGIGLLLAIGCCLAAFVALRRQTRRPDWVRPPRDAIGFYAEGDRVRERRD